jgi:dynein heavy chain, axonemal
VKATSDITVSNIADLVMLNELSGNNVHEFTQTVAESCFKSILTNNANKERWGDVAHREMLEHYNKYLACTTILCGQIKGETNLPMPTDGSPEGEDDANLNAKQGKHKLSMLEGAVIMWTKQIRDVILESPEDTEVIEEPGGVKRVEHLTPDREVAFWETRASHLNAIWSQLTGQRISKVLDFLSSEQSTYAVAFQKTMREVHAHREEANDNLKYLQTLAKWFQKLNEQDDFAGLPGLFKPIVHTILLIWKNSDHYNKPMRLVVLVRMICNAVIAQAVKFVSGSDAIFAFLEDEDFLKAVDTLKTALKVCGAFKAIYFDFKDMAANECPQNPWAVTPAAIFVRLNAFMERCMDMLELCHTYVCFMIILSIYPLQFTQL